jgi:hypothetical protein
MDAERFRDCGNNTESHIALASLDAADIGPVPSSARRQFFLSPAFEMASSPDFCPKELLDGHAGSRP